MGFWKNKYFFSHLFKSKHIRGKIVYFDRETTIYGKFQSAIQI